MSFVRTRVRSLFLGAGRTDGRADGPAGPRPDGSRRPDVGLPGRIATRTDRRTRGRADGRPDGRPFHYKPIRPVFKSYFVLATVKSE